MPDQYVIASKPVLVLQIPYRSADVVYVCRMVDGTCRIDRDVFLSAKGLVRVVGAEIKIVMGSGTGSVLRNSRPTSLRIWIWT